ncbi:hypothetical protein N9M73_00300 [Rhodobacteraceae bacterium]|nr:hypothetical protein [Paracoccaceae bacterium]
MTDLSNVEAASLKLGIRSEYIGIVDAGHENSIAAQVQRVEDLGNYKLVSSTFGEFTIKVKAERDMEIPADTINLQFPADNCCVYANDELV